MGALTRSLFVGVLCGAVAPGCGGAEVEVQRSAPSTAVEAPTAPAAPIASSPAPAATSDAPRLAAQLEKQAKALADEREARDGQLKLELQQSLASLPAPQGSASGGGSAPQRDPPEVVMKIETSAVSGHYKGGAYEFAVEMRSFVISRCMDKAQGSDTKGTFAVSLRFDGQGTLLTPKVASTSFRNEELKQCLLEVFADLNPARHTMNGDDTQANGRATIKLTLEKPAGF